jgi:DNA-binding response OmpR family regulator
MERAVAEGRPEILIVDDEPEVCWALRRLLSKSGFVATMAHSGREAMSLFNTRRFPLVFLDAKLPDLDGLEIAQQMRQLNREVYIVLLSGYFSGHDRAVHEAQAGGLVQHFVGKPFRHEEVIEIARLAISRWRG